MKLWDNTYTSYMQELEKQPESEDSYNDFTEQVRDYNVKVQTEYDGEADVPLFIPSKIDIIAIKKQIKDFQHLWKKIEETQNDSQVLSGPEETVLEETDSEVPPVKIQEVVE